MDDDKKKMLKELHVLYKRDASLFDELVKEYSTFGREIFPVDRRRRTKRTPDVANWVWAHVQFLIWRDKLDVKEACKLIAQRGMVVKIKGDDNVVFTYDAGGGEAGKISGDSIKDIYHKVSRTDAADLILNQLKDAHEDKRSVFTKEDLNRLFPPHKT